MRPYLIYAAVALTFLPTLRAGAQDAEKTEKDPAEAKRHIDKEGGFSYVPPEGWTVREFPGLKYKLLFGPTADKFTSNINVVDEMYVGSIENYITATKEQLPKAIKKFRLIKQEPFQTTAGLKTHRVIIEGEQQGHLLRQTFYLFPTPKKMFVVTCTTTAAGGEKLDATFESCMKTFRFETP